MRTAQDLLTELNASDESPRIEAKRAREIGKSIMETVIAYANEPGLGGGYLLLGVDWTLDANGGWTEKPCWWYLCPRSMSARSRCMCRLLDCPRGPFVALAPQTSAA